MPVTGAGSLPNFMQAINQQQGTAVQFAAAIAQLKQAEEQFKVRMKFEREAFDFDKKRWEAERGLLDKKLQRMEYENQALQQDMETQQAVPGAFSKLATAFGGLAQAATAGDKEALGEAQKRMAEVMADPEVAKTAPVTIPGMRNMALALGFSEQLVTKNFGAAAGTPELQTGTELLEYEQKLGTQMIKRMTGKTDEELEEGYRERVQANNDHLRAITSQISGLSDQLRLQADVAMTSSLSGLNAAMKKVGSGDTSALSSLTTSLNQVAGKVTDSQQLEAINGRIAELRQWQENNLSLHREHLLDKQKQAAANYFARAIADKNRRLAVTKAGSAAAAVASLETSAVVGNTLTKIYGTITGTKQYRDYMESSDETTIQQSYALLKDDVASQTSDVDLQNTILAAMRLAKEQYGGSRPAKEEDKSAAAAATIRPPGTGEITIR